MAKPPSWMKMEYCGVTKSGNEGVILCIKWWYMPILFLRALFSKRREVPQSYDGMEITEVRFGCRP